MHGLGGVLNYESQYVGRCTVNRSHRHLIKIGREETVAFHIRLNILKALKRDVCRQFRECGNAVCCPLGYVHAVKLQDIDLGGSLVKLNLHLDDTARILVTVIAERDAYGLAR